MREHGAIEDYLATGDAILERLSTREIPATLKPFLADFKKEHAAYEKHEKAVKTAKEERDKALIAVAGADAKLDASVLLLADGLVTAGLGKRKNPFQEFSPFPPARIVELAYKVEVKEVGKLLTKIKRKKPEGALHEAVASCEEKAEVSEIAVKKNTGAQSNYQEALKNRDALLPAWLRAYGRLKTAGATAWIDHMATYDVVFAPPDKVARPVHRRAHDETPPAPKPAKKPAAKKAPAASAPPEETPGEAEASSGA